MLTKDAVGVLAGHGWHSGARLERIHLHPLRSVSARGTSGFPSSLREERLEGTLDTKGPHGTRPPQQLCWTYFAANASARICFIASCASDGSAPVLLGKR